MKHFFDVDIAKKYGVQCAVILENLYFWIEKNRANDRHYYDGHYWTYNSKKAFADLMPYMTPKQIDYAIKKLVDADVLITGNYNKSAYDRTLWYAITNYGYSILQNCQMGETKMENGNPENVQPIPYINTDNKHTDINTDSKRVDYASIVNMYNDICISFPHIRSLSDARKKAIKARLHTYSIDDFKLLFEKAEASDFLKGKNNRDWQANFDWLIKDANMAKVLDGNYDNKGQASKPASSQYDGLDEYFIKQMHQKPTDSGIDYNAEDAPF